MVDVSSPLVTYLKPPGAVQSRQSPLHHPPVPAQPFTGLDHAPGGARGDAPLPQGLAAAREVLAFVGVRSGC
jgi:hypothetical protein